MSIKILGSAGMNNAAVNVHSRERLAWGFLLSGCFIFLIVAVTIPIGINAFIQNATQELATAVQANQGTIRISDDTGLRRAILVGEPTQAIEVGTNILTDETGTGLVFVSLPNSGDLLARLQVYANATLRLERANAPRFEISNEAHELTIQLQHGRLRLTLPEFQKRPTILNLITPQGQITIDEPGQYSLEVTAEKTGVTVQSGMATLNGAGRIRRLSSDQRAEIPTGQAPTEPLTPERNLITNGDFSQNMTDWVPFAWKIERPDQPKGDTQFLEVNGEPVLRVIRDGVGHADVRIRQLINQDVTDFASLQLQLTFRIVGQDLGVCGVQGSECPLFVKLNYVDENGANQIWQHGFFGVGEFSGDTPGLCMLCAVVQSQHENVSLNQIKFYDVDIRNELARQGVSPPRFIESIDLAFSGHSFEVEVFDVSLILEE